MKRTIAAGLSAALLCGMVVPAFAADTKTATNTTGTTQTQPTAPVKLTFDKLEETVRQNNVTIKANNNTVLSAEKTDVSDQYIESYFQLSEQISSYQKQIKELQKTLNSLDASKKENAGLRKTLESQISILQRNLAAAEASYRNLDDDEDDAEEDQEKTVDHTRRQMQNAADEICLSAENTYISLRGMKYTLNQTNRSIQQLDRNTKKLADTIRAVLPAEDCDYFGAPKVEELHSEILYIGFWTDKGNADSATLELLSKLRDKKVFLFGTAGFGGSEAYFQKNLEHVKQSVGPSNSVFGEYMCQGKMPQSVRDRYMKMKTQPEHPANIDALIENFDRALSHPDEDDLERLRKIVLDRQ